MWFLTSKMVRMVKSLLVGFPPLLHSSPRSLPLRESSSYLIMQFGKKLNRWKPKLLIYRDYKTFSLETFSSELFSKLDKRTANTKHLIKKTFLR